LQLHLAECFDLRRIWTLEIMFFQSSAALHVQVARRHIDMAMLPSFGVVSPHTQVRG
jgi:hypothetical protein